MAKVNLGVIYKDAGRLEDALALLEDVHPVLKENPGFGRVNDHLIVLYGKTGKPEQALAAAKETLAILRKQNPPGGPQLASRLAQLGLALLEINQFADAESVLRECLEIRRQHLPESWLTFNARSLLGAARWDRESLTKPSRCY